MSEEKEAAGPDVWQISVLYDVEKTSTLILTVSKDCYTAELFEKLRQHPKAPKIDDFQIFSISGTSRNSLVESLEERLSDYGITDRSALALVANLAGGVWPTVDEVAAEPRLLKPADGITLTTISAKHPDVLGIEDDGPGVIMRCGHATAPMPLALYCLGELDKGKDEIRCPKCNDKWTLALLKPAACLTQNEITEFEQRAHINFFKNNQSEMNPCPKCSIFSRPRRAEDKRVVCENCTSHSGKTFEFCWTCLGEWKTSGSEACGNPTCGSKKRLLEILASCETMKLNGIEVPSKRACPNCSIIIDHKTGCKHMTCRCCRYEFCFICLRKYPCGTDVFSPCDVAPRQSSDTNYIGASIDTEQQLYSEESSDDSWSSDETFSNLLAVFLAAMDEVDDHNHDSNAVSIDDITVSPNSLISSPPDDVTVNTSNDVVSSMTISARENTVNAGNTAVDNSLIRSDTEDRCNLGSGDAHANSVNDVEVTQLQTNNNTVQPNKTLETQKVPSSTSTATSRPTNRSNTRRVCIIQ